MLDQRYHVVAMVEGDVEGVVSAALILMNSHVGGLQRASREILAEIIPHAVELVGQAIGADPYLRSQQRGVAVAGMQDNLAAGGRDSNPRGLVNKLLARMERKRAGRIRGASNTGGGWLRRLVGRGRP